MTKEKPHCENCGKITTELQPFKEFDELCKDCITEIQKPLGDPDHDCPNCFKNNPDLPL